MRQPFDRYVTAGEMAARDRWVAQHLLGGTQPPFSFVYDHQPANSLLPNWRCTRQSVAAPVTAVPEAVPEAVRGTIEGRTSHVVDYQDPASGLVVRCVAATYAAFPTVEWTVYLRNGGETDTPLIEAVQALDLALAPPGVEDHAGPADGAAGRAGGAASLALVPPRGVVLHHAVGSPARADDYRPLETVLRAGVETRLAARGGRPSDTDLPFVNLAWPGGGVVAAVGWPGQWAASFQRDAQGSVHLRAGQEHTRFVLHPGEAVRGPLIVLQLLWKYPRPRRAPAHLHAAVVRRAAHGELL
jgi:alpha-galactosidase